MWDTMHYIPWCERMIITMAIRLARWREKTKTRSLGTLLIGFWCPSVAISLFFSRQRGDLVDLRCLGAQGARFEAKIGAPRLRAKSVIFEVSWVALSSPRAVPELSWLLWAALGCSWAAPGCSWLLPAPPTTKPQAHPEHDTQHGQLPLDLALHSEFSKQPGVHHWTRPT